MRTLLAVLAAALPLAVVAPPASALAPGSLYAVSGAPGANAFLPGLAGNSSLEQGPASASPQQNSNTHKLSTDGRFLTFVSLADGMSPVDDDRYANVYVQDRDTGAIDVISQPAPGGTVDGPSYYPTISGDGNRVVFASLARLSPLDTDDEYDVYLRDREAQTTKLISITPGGEQGNGANDLADLSRDGTTVAFRSSVMGTFNSDDDDASADIYTADVATGTLKLVSRATGAAGPDADGECSDPSISGNGSTVAFVTAANNIDDGTNPDPVTDTEDDVYVRVLTTNTTILISRANGVAGAKGANDSRDPAISDDGTGVAFQSYAGDLNPGPEGFPSIYYRTAAGMTTLVSRASVADGNTPADGQNYAPIVSSEGGETRITFTSTGNVLMPGNTHSRSYAFTRTLSSSTTVLASVAQSGDPLAVWGPAVVPALGHDVAFAIFDPAANPDDDDDYASVQVRSGSSTTWRSRPPAGSPWTGGSASAGIGTETGNLTSADGRFVLFSSSANVYLPAGVSGGVQPAYVRDLATGAILIASRADGPDGAPVYASDATISADGRYVAFSSDQPLADGVPAGKYMVYVRDLVAGTTRLVSRNGATPADDTAGSPVISGDGRFVAYTSTASNLGGVAGDTHVYRTDLASGETVLVSRATGAVGAPAAEGAYQPTISHDGARVAFTSYGADLDPIDTGNTDLSVFVRDVAAATTVLASVSTGGANADGGTDVRGISADGTRVLMASTATNLDPADTDPQRYDAYLRDLTTGTTSLVSAAGAADFGVSNPVLSADGRSVGFLTREPVTADDTDTEQDLFVRTLDSGAVERVGNALDGTPLPGSVTTAALNGDASCAVLGMGGTGAYFDDPVPPLLLPGSPLNSPDHSYVLHVARSSACLPTLGVTPGGGGGGGGGGGTVDKVKPVVSKVSLTNKRFRRSGKPTAVSAAAKARKRAKVGTTLRFTLSEPSRVTVLIERKTSGRKIGKSCRKATKKLRKRKRCVRYVKAGTLTRKSLKAGANKLAFSGRVGRRALALGTYRFTVTAVDAAGNRSAAKTVSFTIVKR